MLKTVLNTESPPHSPESPLSPERSTPKVVDAEKASEAAYKLRSPQYRAKVRLVLEWLGRPMTMGEYRKLDDIVDWGAFSESIENPTIPAICHMTDIGGRIVKVNGKPVTFLEQIPIKHRTNPQKWCEWKGRAKVFVKWW